MFDLIKTLQKNSVEAIIENKNNMYNNIINLAVNASKEGRNSIKVYKEHHSILEESHYEEVMQRLKSEGFKITRSHHKVTKSRKIYTISWGNK